MESRDRKQRITRGMYRGVKISIGTLDRIIVLGIAAIALLILVGVNRSDGFRVTYNSMGGSDVAYQTYLYDEPLQLETPSREGYEFSGWYFDEGCSNPATENMNVQSDLTLYAGWTPAS